MNVLTEMPLELWITFAACFIIGFACACAMGFCVSRGYMAALRMLHNRVAKECRALENVKRNRLGKRGRHYYGGKYPPR